jgi:hypothetical protein
MAFFMKKLVAVLVALALVALAVGIFTLESQSRSEGPLYRQLITKGAPSVSISALDRVLATPEKFSALILYNACGVAFHEKRLEDAGFLLYVAQLRTRFDKAMFPPTGTGGNNPMLALAAINQQLSEVVNPAIMREPKVFAKILARVKSWNPKVAAAYEPGWEYSKKESEKHAEDAVAENRKEFMYHMNGMSTLLSDGAYSSAFILVQDYNLRLNGDTNRPSKEAYDAAIQTIKRIEKEKGINAITSVIQK